MILKEEIASAVAGQKKVVLKNNSVTKREAAKNLKPSSTHIEVITGIRRCGKSTLMRQIISESQTDFSYLNFEDPRIFGFEIGDFPKLDEVFGAENSTYFFDEIQNVPGWEVYVRQLHDRGEKVYVTGSNASLLSRELGTRLTGRYLAHEIFPFSYREFLEYNARPDEQASFEEYLNSGGFPEYLRDKNPEVLQNLLKDIVFRDIAIRYSIKNTKTLMDITLFLISNVGKEMSFNSLKKTFEVGSATTVSDYLSWLEDAYLLFFLPRFSWSAKSISKNPKKVYCIDTGFAKANSLSFSKDQGRLLENLVYILLRKTRLKTFYFRENKECDFVVFEGDSCKWLIQVTERIHLDNQKREVDGLTEAMEFFGKTEGFILTLDQRDTLSSEGKTFRILPVKEFLAEYLNKP
ncbi:putative AAA+ superfamily ATPase [Algoriphagus sp. 4150]|uniref:ATP-binding protein n=1 Tax=Algoriphagus sp. 4150 TaxID=2817756 RepID=UPI002855FAD6|nr:ATP-binding protein [Algoriphagus sp. 4150]MDR7128786.1 putative AAA+ superfamily ATPase [Algoriphagus sp. 4150]